MSDNERVNKSSFPKEFFDLMNFINEGKKYRGMALVCLINEAKDLGDGTVNIVHHNPYLKMVNHLTSHELALMFVGVQNILQDIIDLGNEKFGDNRMEEQIKNVQKQAQFQHEVEGKSFVEMTKAEQMLYTEYDGNNNYQSYYADISDKEPDHN